MKDLLEYTRLVFEERYWKENRFRCVKDVVSRNFGKCICIPGMAMNYCIIVAACCYCTEGITEQIEWNEEHKIYLPNCFFQDKKIVPLFREYKSKDETILKNDLCDEEINNYSYIKLRDNDVLNQCYIKDGKQIFKESLLCGKVEEFSNSEGYFRLFSSIAETYRGINDLEVYSEQLFRLFMFLLPYTALNVISKNYEVQKDNLDFLEYNKKLLKEYKELGEGKQNIDTMSAEQIGNTFNCVTNFTGFDFLAVYDSFTKNRGPYSGKELDELVKKQLDICSKISKRIQKVIDKMQFAKA